MTIIQVCSWALQAAVAVTVFGYGLTAQREDVLWVLRRPRILFVSLVSIFVVMPVIALAIHVYLDFTYAAEVALVVIALTPIPALLPRTQVQSGGRARYAYGLAFAVALVSIVLVPALADLLGRLLGHPYGVSPFFIGQTIAVQVLAPLVLGLLLRQVLPRAGDRIGGAAVTAANAVTLAALAVLLILVFPVVLKAASLVTLLVMVGFVAAGLAVGHALGGPDPADSTVLAIATANRNPGLAIGIAASNFPAQSFAGTVILYALVANIVVTLYRRALARRAIRKETV